MSGNSDFDWASSIATRSRVHYLEKARKNNLSLEDGILKADPDDSRSYKAWRNYKLTVKDGGSVMEVHLSEGGKNFSGLAERLPKLRVTPQYRDIVSSVYSDVQKDKLIVGVRFVPLTNTNGRTQNGEKLYRSVLNLAIKPALSTLFS